MSTEVEQQQTTATASTPDTPKDKYNFVYWASFLIGLTILLPWNILITVSGYWDYKFRNVSADVVDSNASSTEGQPLTELQLLWPSYNATASLVPNALFVVLHAMFGHKFHMRLRIIGSQIGLGLSMLAVTILSILNTDEWQDLFFSLSITAIVLMNAFSAVFQGSMSSVLSPFPPEYMGNWNIGCGMGGLLPSIAYIVILLTKDGDFQMAGFICFAFTMAICVLCFLTTIWMEKVEYYQFYYSKLVSLFGAGSRTKDDSEEEDFKVTDKLIQVSSQTIGLYLNLGLKAWIYLIVIFLNFMVTLSVFPAVCVLVESYDSDPNGDWAKIYYVPVACFLVFNIGDYVGKQLAVWIQIPGPSRIGITILSLATALRFAFIPLFMFCYVAPNNRTTEVVFHSDAWYITFMVVMSVSNGYIGNIAMMFGPKATQSQFQETTAAALVAFLVVGCGVGSGISNALVKAL